MAGVKHLNLTPALVEKGSDLVQDGQTLCATMSPLDNTLAVFVAPTNLEQDPKNDSNEPIYLASFESIPVSERRLFISDTLIIFAAFQNLLKTARQHEPDWIQSPENLQAIRKLGIDYVNFIKECWIHASQPLPRQDSPQFSSDHYRSLYTCFSLFVVLYLPEPGYEEAPVGDELMEWLNIHFIEPSTEEGDQLSSLDRPWEDEAFWPYLTRTVLRGLSKASLFFLGSLANHPSEDVQDLAHTLAPLIETQPRLQNFDVEREFAYATRRWMDKVKALRIEMERVPEDGRFDEFENWWDRLSDIVGILEGRSQVIKRVCQELGADWKEVCATWGVFIDTHLRRHELFEVVGQMLEEIPPDPTNLEDMVHAALFSGDLSQALKHASQLDPWLSAHFADMMSPLALISNATDVESDLSFRDEYVLAYAEYLHSDHTLWRITLDYMYSCDEIGKRQADEVLLRVPLRLQEQTSKQIETSIKSGDIVGVLKDVNEICYQHQREMVRRTVLRIGAQSLMRGKDYALAVSYSISAEDWVGLGRIVNQVLEEYTLSGPKQFTEYALSVAPTVQEMHNQAMVHGVFVHRMIFAVRYAHFNQMRERGEVQNAAAELIAIFRDDVAPKSWWVVLLRDSIELLQYGTSLLFSTSEATLLLQKLEEIFIRTSQGSGDEYLIILMRTLQATGEEPALDRLKIVRLALAKYFAKSKVWDLAST
ncbi:hypothetical protein BDN72DRAFT_939980 [Pluteus cervinus]|uniref:Uncharacterized protein n=1 Tax=Pluteus cervinus TaxID=181527 RepID=A0ACD3A560_9AGAR|nr:hypothetical protein BDN72DRAFT_939980 [Pluteus cervinus]